MKKTVSTKKQNNAALSEKEKASRRAEKLAALLQYYNEIVNGEKPVPEKVHITLNHTGKMEYLQSISTACAINPHCLKYSKNSDNICYKCYAFTLTNARSINSSKSYINNYYLLNNAILRPDQIPFINAAYFRFEAFGDIATETAFINYLLIATANSHCTFAIWTKNAFIMESVFNKGYKKPDNLIIIISSPRINYQIDINKYSFADKVFTVYDKDYAADHDIIINCAKDPFKVTSDMTKKDIDKLNKNRSCAHCLKCYTHNNTVYINELLK